MIHLQQAVIVEGKYDKIRLSNVLDALILSTDGFGIFKDDEKTALIRTLAKQKGIIIMTDSDSAGFLIRNHLNNIVQEGTIINVCLPEILGKEKRKRHPSAEGLLGVEGIADDVIVRALEQAGVIGTAPPNQPVTKTMLYADGFSGTPDCAVRREALCRELGIPVSVSPAMLPKLITQIAGADGYRQAVERLSMKFGQNT